MTNGWSIASFNSSPESSEAVEEPEVGIAYVSDAWAPAPEMISSIQPPSLFVRAPSYEHAGASN